MAIDFDHDSRLVKMELFLPANTNAEVRAIQKITNKLNKRYHGSTHSVARPPVFRGWYRDSDGSWIPDAVCLLFVVAMVNLEHEKANVELRRIIEQVDKEYKRANSPQKEILMILGSKNVAKLINTDSFV